MKETPAKQRILEAALQEFGEKGYQQASTNQIAQLANVSKGAIFKNFSSKHELFYAVYQQALAQFLQAYYAYDKLDHFDVFTQMSALIIWKSAYMNQHPLLKNVLWEAMMDAPPPLKEKISLSFESLRALSVESLLAKVKLDQLNPALEVATVQRFLLIAIAGLQAVYLHQSMNQEAMEQAQKEALEFLTIIMKGMSV